MISVFFIVIVIFTLDTHMTGTLIPIVTSGLGVLLSWFGIGCYIKNRSIPSWIGNLISSIFTFAVLIGMMVNGLTSIASAPLILLSSLLLSNRIFFSIISVVLSFGSVFIAYTLFPFPESSYVMKSVLTTLIVAMMGHFFYALADQYIKERDNKEVALSEAKDAADKANEKLKVLASQDSLTQLLNHEAILEKHAFFHSDSARYDHPYSILMIDIDFFKQVNDQLGHQEGDKVIQQLAEILCDRIRSTDAVGRYGGEEFLVILPHTEAIDARQFAENLRHIIEQHKFFDFERALTVSIGLATFQKDKEPWEILKIADEQLYLAKESGRNCVRSKDCSL
jgi:diguanylate cyclase (GGDEF)-like protein